MYDSVGTPPQFHRVKLHPLFILLLALAVCQPKTGLSPRVAVAKKEKDVYLAELFRTKGVVYPPQSVFLRAFKQEGLLEVWSKSDLAVKYTLIKTYQICKKSGGPGPKRKEGDRQVPEGFYLLNRFNERSKFYLSLGLNYPNASDQILSDADQPGGDIFIHGDCVSLGCLAMTDDGIKEIFWIAFQAREKGQKSIPVHIFPFRFGTGRAVSERSEPRELKDFWKNLRVGFRFFEENGFPPAVGVDKNGWYRFFKPEDALSGQ